MKRRLWILPLLGLSLVAGRVNAQGYYYPPRTTPFARPLLSPYVNLVNGTNPAIQYYGIVRPQLNLFSDVNQLQYQNALLQQQATTGTPLPGEVVTGVPGHFMTQSRYFMTQYTSPGIAGRTGFGTMSAGRPGLGAPGSMAAGRTGSFVPPTPGAQTRPPGSTR
jgi:hypothetical protein